MSQHDSLQGADRMTKTILLSDFDYEQMHDEIIHEIRVENSRLVLCFNDLHFHGAFSKAQIVFSGFDDILYDVRFEFFTWEGTRIQYGRRLCLDEMMREGLANKTFEVVDFWLRYKSAKIFGKCRDTATGMAEDFTLEIDADEISYQFMK